MAHKKAGEVTLAGPQDFARPCGFLPRSMASATEQRARAIDALFADYSVRRAAKSLDDADAAQRTGGFGIGWSGPIS